MWEAYDREIWRLTGRDWWGLMRKHVKHGFIITAVVAAGSALTEGALGASRGPVAAAVVAFLGGWFLLTISFLAFARYRAPARLARDLVSKRERADARVPKPAPPPDKGERTGVLRLCIDLEAEAKRWTNRTRRPPPDFPRALQLANEVTKWCEEKLLPMLRFCGRSGEAETLQTYMHAVSEAPDEVGMIGSTRKLVEKIQGSCESLVRQAERDVASLSKV